MKEKKHDFLTWKSFPSSAKLTNDEIKGWAWWGYVYENLSVEPGAVLSIRVKAKQKDVTHHVSHIPIDGFDGIEWRRMASLHLPLGTFDWKEHRRDIVVPPSIIAIRSSPAGGAGSEELPGITWYDDLKVYQDGDLIFSEDFTNWNSYIPYLIVGGIVSVIVGLIGATKALKMW